MAQGEQGQGQGQGQGQQNQLQAMARNFVNHLKLPDFDENGTESSPLQNYLSHSLVIDDGACNSSQGSFSRIDTSFNTEDNDEQAIVYGKRESPKFSTSDSECGYIEFQSIIRQGISVPLNS